MSSSPLSILVVDDDDPIRTVIVRVLQRQGHRVSQAAGGDQALRIFETEHFHAAFLDLVMPGKDGATLQRLMRAQRPELAVVFITGFKASIATLPPETVIVMKPFTPQSLLDGLRRARG